jgi:hypothetical protein
MPVCIGTQGWCLKHPSACGTLDVLSSPSAPGSQGHRTSLGTQGATRGRSSNAQPLKDGRHSLPFSNCRARINATSHVTLSHEDHVSIPRATLSKIGMCWRRIAQESLSDGVGIWIDSRLISSQSFLSPIVPAVSVVAYLGLEDCGTLRGG